MTLKRPPIPEQAVRTSVLNLDRGRLKERADEVAAEEPMEVRVLREENGQLLRHSIAVTMRTPGSDFELAAGFLFSEGIIPDRQAIADIAYCGAVPESAQGNVVNVFLRSSVPFDPARFTRNVYTTSSCGVCGKASLEMVRTNCARAPSGDFRLSPDCLLGLPQKLARAQDVFSRTGGLHAAALFDEKGDLLLLREDVGRHNALDKLIGALLLEEKLPASNRLILVSGRASYELVQKALVAGIPALAAVGAPSSLAIDLAREFGMTLVGFLRQGRFNIYTGEHRIEVSA